ncbi:MAG: CBS domain-containing protein, partial [Alphaproteobacteria bacterium]|nr:CBS domain-containing protein [Alphaproteobacteria bacterium]
MLPFQRTIIPHVLAPDQARALITLTPADTARRAAELMAEKHVGALLIMEGDKIAGIFTERDLATRVVAPGLDPGATKLAQVMTRDPDT